MPISIPEIDFARIRPYGQPASRTSAFEELSSILIEQKDEWPSGTRFHRFGNPDGGREGKGVLPNGDVWAWQAKFLFAFDSSAAGQVKKSLVRTLEREPTLKRYFVTLPIDLPAGDTKRSKSAFTLWGEEVAKWQALASEKGLSVEFTFVGTHELTTALTEPKNAGRVRYWFDSDALTTSEQQQRIDDVTAKLGRRYSPELHVDVDAVQVVRPLAALQVTWSAGNGRSRNFVPLASGAGELPRETRMCTNPLFHHATPLCRPQMRHSNASLTPR